MTAMKTCTNKGCGRQFADNHPTACLYHSGPPIFHEGLKGWSCCKKRVTSFDEFLEIPGCSTGPHSDVKEEEKKPVESPRVAQPTAETVQADGSKKEIYGSLPQVPTQPVKGSAPVARPVEEDQDPEDVQVPDGATCKRNGCGYLFKTTSVSRGEGAEAKCVYHSGEPIFHEGSKGYSCCSRKVLEFEEFLKIKGCKEGKHLFVGSPRFKEATRTNEPICRHDWYQSPVDVVISIYAKNTDPAQVQIEFSAQHLKVHVPLPSGQIFSMDTDLFQAIVPEESRYRVSKNKVELTLKKSNGISWAAIEPTDNIKTFTTFGISGTKGTIGGKEMYLATDAPLFALNR